MTQQHPHVQAAFINAIREEGTKAEARNHLQQQWNETCALQNELADALDREAAKDAALRTLMQAVCGPIGFAEAVRHNTGLALPWPSLDAAEAQARAALGDAP
jgi:hypothetical protein